MCRLKRVLGLCFAVSFLLALTAGSVFAAEEKVGGIDPQRVLFQHPKYEQTLEQIKMIADNKQKEAKEAIDKEADNNKKAEIFQEMRKEVAVEEQKLM
jgi:outer membrane protein